MSTLTSKQRFLAALRREIPDRVPVAPDISNYVPLRHTTLPFWDIYFFGAYPHWQAYLDAIDYYGADAWVAPVMYIPFVYEQTDVTVHTVTHYDKSRDAMISDTTTSTPHGVLTSQLLCFRHEPAARTSRPIKDLAKDLPAFWDTEPMPVGIDWDALRPQIEACRARNIAFGVTLPYPGFHMWEGQVQGGIIPLSYIETDRPALLEEWAERDMVRYERQLEIMLESGVLDYLLYGGSGTITLASPALARKYALPALKKWSRMTKEAGLPTMLHSCGKNRELIKMLAEETDIDVANPLEPPPAGDVDLAEAKRLYGQRLGFMGNLHTSDVMLLGTPDYVREMSVRAMRDAGLGGGFILSTGDQCGLGTPDENLFAMVEAAQRYGRYDPVTGELPDLPPPEQA